MAKKRPTTFRTSARTKAQLEVLARDEMRTVSELVDIAVKEFLQRRELEMSQHQLYVVPIVGGPSLEGLRDALFQAEESREAVEFLVDSEQLGLKGPYPVFIHELTRVGKGTDIWKFMGLTVADSLQIVKVVGDYNCTTRQGRIGA